MTTLAKEFKKWYNDPDLDKSPADLFHEFCQVKKINPRVIEDCPESADSSWKIIFPDGSWMYLANPHEAYFHSFAFFHSCPENTDWLKTRRRIEDRLRKDDQFLEAVAEMFIEEFGGKIATK